MSLTNHIIIPIVGSKQNLEDQNIFIPTYFTLTPSKHEELPDFTFWKKSASAFKKFKQKKDRKQKRNQLQNENAEPNPPQHHRKYLKLILREKVPAHTLHDSANTQDKPFGYYDPNEAPLYELHFLKEYQFPSNAMEARIKQERLDEEVRSIKLQRLESQLMDESLSQKMIIEPRFDDPFIIVRKDSVKKTAKNGKSKQIRKERTVLKTKEPEDGQERNRLIMSKVKETPEHREVTRHEEMIVPQLVRIKTSQSAAMLDENDSHSLESEDENAHTPSPTALKKEIFTIQQLMSLAHPKNAAQLLRGSKGSEMKSYSESPQPCNFIQ